MLQTGRTNRKKSKPIEREREIEIKNSAFVKRWERGKSGSEQVGVWFEILNFPPRLLYGFGNFKIRSGRG